MLFRMTFENEWQYMRRTLYMGNMFDMGSLCSFECHLSTSVKVERKEKRKEEEKHPWFAKCIMAWSLLLLLLKFLLIQGVVSLSCDFNNDFCGWQHPVNATDKWILTSELHGNYTTFFRNGQLIYPNFTGHGDLVLSYYLFSNSYEKNEELRVKVGNATLLSVFDESIYWPLSWNSSRLRVDADREKVIIEGIIRNNAVSRIVIDSIKFYEKNASSCPLLLSPLNGTMNCTHDSTAVGTVCVFGCEGGRRVVGSTERRCQPTGEWSGVQPACQTTIRLTEGYTHMDGDVEIQVDGRWGKICIGGGRIQEKLVAMVTCRYLGYEGDAYLMTSPWQRIPRDAWMDLRSCDGTEASVTECVGTFDRYICPYHRKLAVNCNKAPCPGNCSCSGEAVNEIRCRKQDILPQELILIPYYTEKVHIHGVDWSMLKRIMENPANNKKRLKIRLLEFSDAGITRIPKGTFISLYALTFLYLPWNRVESLSSIEDGAFREKGYGLGLDLGYNDITNVTAADMKGKEMLFHLQLNHNRISYIEGGAFNACTQLQSLNLSTNNIRRLEPYTFPSVFQLKLDLSSNRLEEITYDVFGRFGNNINMIFYNNTISKIEPRALDIGYNTLLLGQNKITKFSPDILVGSRSLNFLDISDIALGRITVDLFKDLYRLLLLNAVRDNIHHIEDFAFQGIKDIAYIFLDDNYLTKISKNTFAGPKRLNTL
ncbi:uncharacterized protein LOC116614314 isoform X2 [Nematostella vectensis]|uniref:uncharacterized protein LOC116614314 isoform X2 n=1 Tax=Nematostella vectensis TaxID=45351 RepID=UPI0020777EEA|nr:uncharacterized protein LOC116614314 isoform X2 [Nematostella vectensis]